MNKESEVKLQVKKQVRENGKEGKEGLTYNGKGEEIQKEKKS